MSVTYLYYLNFKKDLIGRYIVAILRVMHKKYMILIIGIVFINFKTTIFGCVLCLKRIPKIKSSIPYFHISTTTNPQLAPIHSKSSRKLLMTIDDLEDNYNFNENDKNNNITNTNTNTTNNNNNEDDEEENKEEDMNEIVKGKMIDAIKWYRSTLSPIMQPNCRFFPSCSNYAMQAINEYGPWKGGILTAWRLLRCNPIGGSGYDPPMWPPPSFR